MSDGLVGEEARARGRIDRAPAGILDRVSEMGIAILRHMPQGGVIEVKADGEPAFLEPADGLLDHAVVNQRAREPAVACRLSQPAIEGAELHGVGSRVADREVVVPGKILRPNPGSSSCAPRCAALLSYL